MPTTRGQTIQSLPTATEDPAERRRLKNILAQRRYRQRKKARFQQLESLESLDTASLATETGADQILSSETITFNDDELNTATAFTPQYDSQFLFLDNGSDVTVESPQYFTEQQSLITPGPSSLSRLSLVSSRNESDPGAFADILITTPGISALKAKMDIFTVMHGPNFQLDVWSPLANSPFCTLNTNGSTGSETSDIFVNPLLPAHFHPTALQRHIPHHPGLDAIPWPSFRDKFLYMMTLPENYRPPITRGSEYEVMMNFLSVMKDAAGGLRVWGGNPFDKDAWEVGSLFYSKYWWAMDVSIIENSNMLRIGRGEDKLVVQMRELHM